MTSFTHDWIDSRGGLIATFSKPFRDMPQDRVGLSILATNDFPRALAALKAVLNVHSPIPAVDVARRPGQQLTQVCTGCGTDDGNFQRWPCPTVRAVEAALRGES